MTKMTFNWSLIIFILLISGCNSSKKVSNQYASAFVANEWKLTNLGEMTIPESSEAGLIFQTDRKVFGSTGCNRLNGTFETKCKNLLQFSPMATTRMSCMEDNKGDIERKFLDALARTESWEITNDALLLKSGETILAKLIAHKNKIGDGTSLNGNWELIDVTGPKITFIGLFPENKPTIYFNVSDSSASGNSSCNAYTIPYKLNGFEIKFGDGLSTLRACDGEGESVFFNTLKKVTNYKISDDKSSLELRMGEITVMRFVRK